MFSTFVANYAPLCVTTVERVETDTTMAAVSESLHAAAATQTDEDFTSKEQLLHTSLNELIYQFLAHTVDMNRTNVIDDLATKNILSRSEVQKIKKQKRPEARVKCLLVMLREKSGEQFESFLTTLSEEGQQSVADVVRQSLHTVHRTGQNPLRSESGKATFSVLHVKLLLQNRKKDQQT